MDRAMPQSARMNLAPRVLPDHLVALVDDVKNFFTHKKLCQERHLCRKLNQTISSSVGAAYSENHFVADEIKIVSEDAAPTELENHFSIGSTKMSRLRRCFQPFIQQTLQLWR